jgi:hypothetical protein
MSKMRKSRKAKKSGSPRKPSAYAAWLKANKSMVEAEVVARLGPKPAFAERSKLQAMLYKQSRA